VPFALWSLVVTQVMDKLLAKYADYAQIEQVADLNASDEAGPSSRSAEDITIAGAHLASTSTLPPRRTPSSERHHFPGHSLQPHDDSRQESFPALFRLEQHHSDPRLQHEWQYTSPEKVSAAKGDIDNTMLAEFAALSSDVYNRPSSSSQAAHVNQTQWVANLLVECARAITGSDSARVKNLMWVLNELSSPYGDSDQRLAAYFLQGLFCRITGTGSSCHRILTTAAEKTYSFDTLRKMILDYQVGKHSKL
jgi:hypothetical protein